MSISSSLNAGVAGLNANASKLATISDNIANSATSGYKRVETDFYNMVLNSGSSGSYSAGGVRTTTSRLIDEGGPLVTTSNSTDLAISGRGFIAVTPSTSVAANSDLPLQLTTTGSFRADANGYLVTTSGLTLLGWPANADGSIPTFPRDSMGGLEPVNISANQFVGNPTTQMSLSVNLPATATEAGASGAIQQMSSEYYGNLGNAQTLGITFTPVVPATGASNQWVMEIRDSASGNAVIGQYTISFNDGATDGGSISTIAETVGGAFDPATGKVTVTTASGPIEIRLGTPGTPNGLTQLSDTFSPGATTRDGALIGNFSRVEIDANGKLSAIYDNGFSKVIYQIPVADVANPNGLTALSNQTYQISANSGGLFLWDAGQGPTGTIAGYALEESATDVAQELTQLIQTQRAYSSNAKIIQTVDEMLQETTNMKR